jgi:3-deoxy-D-manno-octulosonic-acid transferase
MGLPLVGYKAAWTLGLTATAPAWMAAAVMDWWHVRRRITPVKHEGGPAWLWHGASAGEVRGLCAMHESLIWNDDPPATLVSASASSGIAMWNASGYSDVSILPVDISPAWRHWLPDDLQLAIFSETELWPVGLRVLAQRGTPVVIVSARLSERSAFWWRRMGFAQCFAKELHVAAQTDADASRYRSLGVPEERVIVTGSLKWPRGPAANRASVRRRLYMDENDTVIVVGSVRRSEIPIVSQALSQVRQTLPLTQVIIAPRMLADVSYAQQCMYEAGYRVDLLSMLTTKVNANCIVVDSIGELAELYAAANAAVIGGGWEPVGGHNPFEAAVYGIPLAYGPDMSQPGCDALERNGQAVRSNTSDSLGMALIHMLGARSMRRPFAAAESLRDPVETTWEAMRAWGLAPACVELAPINQR